MDLENLFDGVSDDLALIEKAIIRNIQSDIPLLTDVAEYILRSGGKRLRPALVLFSAKLFGYSGEKTIQAAQVVEYLHTATLLHDDVVDKADTRRSLKAARTIWGNEASVLVGDYLFSQVFYMLTQLKDLQVLELMSQTTTLMAKGELLQLTRPYNDVDQDIYLEIIINKTACLFAAAVKMGAVFAQATEVAQQKLYDYGMAIGIAFQIVDDTLDYSPEHDKTGKKVGIDLQERKITLPLIHLLENASDRDRTNVEQILAETVITDQHIAEVVDMMRYYQSTKYSVEMARHYSQEAQTCLRDLPDSSFKQVLTDVAHFIVDRSF